MPILCSTSTTSSKPNLIRQEIEFDFYSLKCSGEKCYVKLNVGQYRLPLNILNCKIVKELKQSNHSVSFITAAYFYGEITTEFRSNCNKCATCGHLSCRYEMLLIS